jgi:hypothetical protein
LAAATAAQLRRELGSAVVTQAMHRILRVEEPAPLPADQGQGHAIEIPSHVRQVIFVPGRPLGVGRLHQHPGRLQPLQTIREQAARQSDPALEIVEPPYAEERQVEDHQGPAIPENVQGAGGGIGLDELVERTRRAAVSGTVFRHDDL